jgi:uracil-DNA glycosylase family 4
VFGKGPRKARLMLVGEQPGDREDIEGEPFVGPAGGVLDRALAEAGIERGDVYLTNAVKHFKWRPQGKRRFHQSPRVGEIAACKPWLEAELEAVKPVGILASARSPGALSTAPRCASPRTAAGCSNRPSPRSRL